MFSTSTQRQHWMHGGPEDLEKIRIDSNNITGQSIVESGKVGQNELLSHKEELYLIRKYLVKQREFCRNFTPPMRKSVVATAFIYMKRFYLHESCMEYHPRNIGVTCAYLACKVDEFNVSIDQFIKNVNGDCRKAQKTILSNELLLMKKLHFQLTVHLPFRAVEGFLIDLRARYPPARDKTELMVPEIDDYLEKSMFTDACFLFTPSQIALAAICNSAEKCKLDLSSYLSDILFKNEPEALSYFHEVADVIRKSIERDLQDSPGKDVMKRIENKMKRLYE